MARYDYHIESQAERDTHNKFPICILQRGVTERLFMNARYRYLYSSSIAAHISLYVATLMLSRIHDIGADKFSALSSRHLAIATVFLSLIFELWHIFARIHFIIGAISHGIIDMVFVEKQKCIFRTQRRYREWCYIANLCGKYKSTCIKARVC